MKSMVFTVAVVAGTTCASTSAQPVTPASRQTVLVSGAQPISPARYRQVRLVNDRIVAIGEWKTYAPAGSDGGTPTLCFDGYHDVGGHSPGEPPVGGRWIFSWAPPPPYDYTGSSWATPMNSVVPAAIPGGAKYFDYLFYENSGTLDEYIAIFTSEEYFDTVAPDPTWMVFDGWQFHYTAPAVGFYYSNLALTDPDVWELPTDGNGGVITITSRDEVGLVPAQQYQLAQWGTQEHMTPAPVPPKVGTSGPNQWVDESTAPTCATTLVTNVADGIFSIECENYSWDFGAAYNPRPFTLAFAMGFDAETTGGCYANCDGSSVQPVLTANDFQCFINKYAGNDPYANCDGSSVQPVLTANDFQCFINKYAGGCT